MRQVMEEAIKLPDAGLDRASAVAGWRSSSLIGVLNLLVAFVIFKGDTSAWVNFKLFGMTGIFFAFVIGQTLFLSKYIEEEEKHERSSNPPRAHPRPADRRAGARRARAGRRIRTCTPAMPARPPAAAITACKIVSDTFEGLRLVMRHRLVYDAVHDNDAH